MGGKELDARLRQALDRRGLVLVLTGAGISAESGLPTFRGPDGMWTPGSPNQRPEELATRAAFTRQPDVLWSWYLHRLALSRRAAPNRAHMALATLEHELGDRFLLITQNVDGLHRRAGSSDERTYEVHGSLRTMRCLFECTSEVFPVPEEVLPPEGPRPIDEATRMHLRCPRCGAPTRPNVLWFDEYYDELHYRFDSALWAASRATLLVAVGTSGVAAIPGLVVERALGSGAVIVDVNPEESLLARGAGAGLHRVRAPASVAVPALVESILRDV